MAKMTIKERYEAGLKVFGWSVDPNGLSLKYKTFKKAGKDRKIFLGKSGAVRIGKNSTGSVPVQDRTKEILIAASEGKEVTSRVL